MDGGQRYVVMYAPMIIARDQATEGVFSLRFVVGTIILESDFVGFLQEINQKTALAVSLVTIGMGIVIAFFTAAQEKKTGASGMLQSFIKSVTPRSRRQRRRHPSHPTIPSLPSGRPVLTLSRKKLTIRFRDGTQNNDSHVC